MSAEGSAPRVTYDREIDAAYLYFVDEVDERKAAITYPCDPNEVRGQINLDFDADGRLLGIEIQDASRFLPAKLLDATDSR